MSATYWLRGVFHPWILGIFRWASWIILKFIPSLFYFRKVPPSKRGLKLPESIEPMLYSSRDVTIICPCFDPPKDFGENLSSWINNHPKKIIVVCDCEENYEKFTFFMELLADLSNTEKVPLILTKTEEGRGKRLALLTGLKSVDTDLVCFVDDDSRWLSDDLLLWLIEPINQDRDIGGVGPNQTVRPKEVDNFSGLETIANIRFYQRIMEAKATSFVDGGCSCLSGRTVLYQTCILQTTEFKKFFKHEEFMGMPLHSGDDKCITRYLMKKNFKTFHQIHKECTISTPFESWSKYIRQMLRWSRNTWRSDLKILFTEPKILFHYPWTCMILLDRMIAPLALLYGLFAIIFFTSTAWHPIALPTWLTYVLLSRTLKITPYFFMNPSHVIFIPLFILFLYITSLLRVYALLTIHKRHWGSKPIPVHNTGPLPDVNITIEDNDSEDGEWNELQEGKERRKSVHWAREESLESVFEYSAEPSVEHSAELKAEELKPLEYQPEDGK